MVLRSFFYSRSERLLSDGCRFAFLMDAILIPQVNVCNKSKKDSFAIALTLTINSLDFECQNH